MAFADTFAPLVFYPRYSKNCSASDGSKRASGGLTFNETKKMKSDLSQVHREIADIVSHDKKGITKTSLSQIPEILEKDWPTLKADLLGGKIQIREMTTSPISFAVFAADSDKAGLKFFNFLAMALPVVAIALSVLVSWWWLSIAVLSVVFFRTAKSFYRTVILQAVTASETIFCFLFSRNTICLQMDGKILFRRND
jgi:hypothetical protein